MNFKKFAAVVAAAALTASISVSSMFAFAEGETPVSPNTSSTGENVVSDGNLQFEYIDGGAKIVGCDKGVTELNIQELLNGYSIIEIGENAFADCQKLSKVTLPKTIKKIDKLAFLNCYALSEITIPESVTEIGDAAFQNCLMLQKADIKGKIQSLTTGAFYNCQLLSEVTLPDTLTYIGACVFDTCASLQEIKIPDSVSCIDAYAFRNCYNLAKMNLPAGLTALGGCAFMNCYEISEITVSEDNQNFTVEDNVLYNKDKTQLFATAPVAVSGNVEIPRSVTVIQPYAFAGCTNLKAVTIPSGVEKIDEGTFGYCSSLTEIVIPEGVTEIGTMAFTNCDNIVRAQLPTTLKTIGPAAFYCNKSLSEISFGGGLETISNGAFLDCPSLMEVNVPASVTEIGQYAFGYESSENGEEAIKVAGFKMKVSAGSKADKYARENGFASEKTGTNLKKIAFIVVCAGIGLATIVIAVVILRKGKKKPDEAAEGEENELTSEETEGYTSILDNENPEDNDTKAKSDDEKNKEEASENE